LIQQSRLDGQFAPSKESGEGLDLDGEGFRALRCKALCLLQLAELQPSETAGVDEAYLAATGEAQAGVRMRGEWSVRSGDQQAAGHAQVHDPLRVGFRASGCNGAGVRCQLADDVLAGAVHLEDGAAFQAGSLDPLRGFECLGIGTEPRFGDTVAAHARIHAPGNGFHLGKLGHGIDCRREARASAKRILALLLGELLVVFATQSLGDAPLSQVDETESEPSQEDTDR